MFGITLTIKRLLVYWKRFPLFIGLAALLCVTAGLAGGFFLSGGGPDPVRLLIVNEDDSMESRLMYNMLSTTESYSQVFSLELADYDDALEQLAAGRVSAVAVLPPGFVESIKTGENLPVTMLYSRAAPLKSQLVSVFADAFADMLRTSQVGVYAALDYARENGTREQYDEMFLQVNIGFLRSVLERERAFAAETVSATGQLGYVAYYGVHALVFLLLLCPVLLLDPLRPQLSRRLAATLDRMGTPPLRWAGGIWCGVWLVLAAFGCAVTLVLLGVAAAMDMALPLGVLPPLLAVLAVSAALALPATLLFDSAASGCLALSALSLASLLLSGGILPLDYLAPPLRAVGTALPHHWAARLLSAGLTGQGDATALLVTLGYGAVLLLLSAALLHRGRGRKL